MSAIISENGTIPVQPSNRPLQERYENLTRDDPPNLLVSENTNNQQTNENEETIYKILSQNATLLIVLLVKILYDYFKKILNFSVLILIFYHANEIVRDEISKQAQRNVNLLIRQLLYISLFIYFRIYNTEDEEIYINLLIMQPLNESNNLLGPLIFYLTMSGILLKVFTVVTKIVITLIPPEKFKCNTRGNIYLLIEALSQMYAAVMPIRSWLNYLLESYSGFEKLFGALLTTSYMVSKAFDLFNRGKLCKKAITAYFGSTVYEHIPSREQMDSAGNNCTICHDQFSNPIILDCQHIFCASCVRKWFSLKETCPLCRTKILEDTTWQYGSTSYFLQLC